MNKHTNKCTPVSDQCKTWCDKTGVCKSCYLGYENINGECLIYGAGRGSQVVENGGNEGHGINGGPVIVKPLPEK